MKRYYCSPKKCAWLDPFEAAKVYPEWNDCTDMPWDEFLAYVIRTTPAENEGLTQ